MQNISLTVNLKDGTVNNWHNIPLPCLVYENGCETTSLDLFAYSWNEPENCIFSVLIKFEAKMIRNEEKYYIVKDSFTKISNHHTRGRDTQQFMLKILNKPQFICGHPKIVYPTQYESLFIAYQNGFKMDTGLQINASANTGIIHSEQNLTCDLRKK